ncbi:MAG TPA: hypothetical protein VFY53_11550 [Rhodoplanes sp.]|nr:hypothetical protein [Rhodoplanes sp.]
MSIFLRQKKAVGRLSQRKSYGQEHRRLRPVQAPRYPNHRFVFVAGRPITRARPPGAAV